MEFMVFLCLGIFTVIIITWLNGRIGADTADLANMSPLLGMKLFFIGMIAISAMFLPGISGSTLLLIFGMYIPVINAVRGLMSMNFASFPALGLGNLNLAAAFIGLGLVPGMHFIKEWSENYER